MRGGKEGFLDDNTVTECTAMFSTFTVAMVLLFNFLRTVEKKKNVDKEREIRS